MKMKSGSTNIWVINGHSHPPHINGLGWRIEWFQYKMISRKCGVGWALHLTD